MPRPRTWTDDDLRAAVAASSTYKEVQQRLGLSSGSSHVAIRVRIAELGIDDGHLRMEHRRKRSAQARARRERERAEAPSGPSTPPGARTWTDDDLRAAVAAATSLNGVFRELDMVPGGDQWQMMQDHIVRLKLATEHWKHPLPRRRSGRKRSWTDQQLVDALATARSVAEVMRELGVRGGGAQRVVRRRIEQLGLDTSHLAGKTWARGVANPSKRTGQPLEEILIAGSDYRNTTRLKERLIAEGLLEPRCGICGVEEWNGQPAPLHLDHVNGDRRDHRLTNLRLLCPNCHAQTETYGGRNVGRYAPRDG